MPRRVHGIPAQDKAQAVGKTNSAAGRALSGEIKSGCKAQTERYRGGEGRRDEEEQGEKEKRGQRGLGEQRDIYAGEA